MAELKCLHCAFQRLCDFECLFWVHEGLQGCAFASFELFALLDISDEHQHANTSNVTEFASANGTRNDGHLWNRLFAF